MPPSTRRSRDFNKGDWIVHLDYGVGQIKGVETKRLEGERSSYYKVKTSDSTLFVPVEDVDRKRLRPLASKSQFGRAIRVLKTAPDEMSPDHNERKRLIRKASADGSLLAVCRLVRDLSARRWSNRLNSTEERALRRFKSRLLSEWSICRDVPLEEARNQLNNVLQEGRSKLEA